MTTDPLYQPRKRPVLAGMLHYDDGFVVGRDPQHRARFRARTVALRLVGAIVCLCAVVFMIKAAEWIWVAHPLHPDIVHDPNHDHGHSRAPSPAVMAHQQALTAWRRAEEARRDIRLRFMQPWAQAGATRLQQLSAERAQYTYEMRAAPTRCRKALTSLLPVGWVVEGQSLGRSANIGRPGTWQVWGVLTAIDETGVRRRHHYQCDFAGADLADIVIADRITRANPVSLLSGR